MAIWLTQHWLRLEFALLQGKVLRFGTEQGAVYMLYPAGRFPSAKDLEPTVFERTAREVNFYGVKRHPRF
jgi:hypothetical protein